ncbi:MAG: hydroxymethylglutaryl-CoA lyase [Chthoniobacterales bacterium]
METVKLIECPRDAWQGLPRQIPTERKVEYLRALSAAGFRHLDAVSFVSPEAVPQMADSEEVLRQLGDTGDVEIIGIVVNEKGAERAIATGAVSTLGFPFSISGTFLRRNQNQSLEENRASLKAISEQARDAGLEMVAYISMAFGNPYGDPWSEAQVADAAAFISGLGIACVSLADTVGTAQPELVQRVVAAVVDQSCAGELGVHLHSTRAGAVPKILAAYDAGCRRFDAAIGGLGGCPFAQDDLIGNIPTEEVARALRQREIELPIASELEALSARSAEISGEFGQA